MRAPALVLCLALLMPHAAHAQAVTPAERSAITDVIRGQMQAFGRDDAAGAYAYAAPAIQSIYGDPDVFLTMVRRLYPPVYRPRAVDFVEAERRDGAVVQKVELIGPDGRPALAVYSMERQPDGVWKIIGCTLTASERVGA